MCCQDFRDEVLASATGTTVKHTSPERIKRFRFRLPPLPEQRAIAHILGTLDDKIELNRRMNETLEAMARAIFKSWFVDFDPVRAKAEGREPELPKHLSALFPRRFQGAEPGQIPEGWRVYRWRELVTLEYGKSLSG
jgi:type I restriction enzyme S subunit